MEQLITINNKNITAIEYNNQRVVTFSQIDKVHEKSNDTARRQFNRHRDRFFIGLDYFVTNSPEAKSLGFTAPNGLVLITERGYLKICKTFTDEFSWNIQDRLVDCYFRVKIQNQQASQWDSRSLSKLLITAGQELERKDLVIQHKNQVISTLAPKAEYYDKVQKMDEWCEMEVVAKQLCLVRNHKIMGRTNLYDYLRELGVIEQGTRRPYQQFVNNGFFKVVEKTWTDSYGKEHISYKTVVSPKGKDFILRTYKREEQTEGD